MFRPLALFLGIAAASAAGAPAHAAGGNSLQIVVSKDSQSLVVYDGDQIVARSRVSTGKEGHDTPSGIFSILQKEKYHESNLYSNAPMPWMQRLTWSGIALHESSSVPNYPASHGCVRMPAAFAKALYQITDRGAHVIITDREMAPFAISHANLFRPEMPVSDDQLLSDAELRPGTFDASSKPTQIAMAGVPPKLGASAKVVLEDGPPVRIMITRRTFSDTVKDTQKLLTDLGFDAGTPDGHIGRQTIEAIKGFKRWKNLPLKGDHVTPQFLDALYTSSGLGRPPLGMIMVRQKMRPLFEAPVEIAEPQLALGTHFLEAAKVNRFSGKADWRALTLENHLSRAAMNTYGITSQQGAEDEDAAMRALDRITIPDNIRHKINLLLTEGSSLTITDTGASNETGQGTDFITLTQRG